MFILAVLSSVLLLLIAWFDFKERSIPIVLIVLEAVVLLFYFPMQHIYGYYFGVGLNLVIGFLHVGLVAFWMKIKKKELSFFKDAFGWGDVALIVLGAFFFNSFFYVFFILVSSLLSLGYAGVVKIFATKSSPVLIPLAGIMALLLFVVQLIYIEERMFLTIEGIQGMLNWRVL